MRALAELEADPDDPRHGTYTGYCYGCRCDRCVRENRDYMRKWREVHRVGEPKKKGESIRLRHLKECAKPREVYIHNGGWIKI